MTPLDPAVAAVAPPRSRPVYGLVGAVLLAGIAATTLAAPLIVPHDPLAQDLTALLRPPLSPGHLLGTDQLGRDVLSRIIHGGRVALGVSVLATAVAAT